ncbi:hypothetical protein [Schaalia canis]|uniref:EcsC family protein n=1 Tax=Schaalia canis TaxID=100469 RepID=A0A3P1SCT4_9ACTO|nr:hypothetical protein [Schaalia canis]RRC94849.1 hypothetical protein EII11_08205 [Schaalia canis]
MLGWSKKKEIAPVTDGVSSLIPGAKTFTPEMASFVDGETEEFASSVLRRAASLPFVKVDRDSFLRKEIGRYYPKADSEKAVALSPLAAGLSMAQIDRIAAKVINAEAKQTAGLSFITGLPGGIGLAVAVPADVIQYFGHVIRVEQKLAYLYGWRSLLNEDGEVDDNTMHDLLMLMGVMLGVEAAEKAVTALASTVAQQSMAKAAKRKALLATAESPVRRLILRVLGIKLTEEATSKAVGKMLPVVGGVISGGLTYATFKPSAKRLQAYLRTLPPATGAGVVEGQVVQGQVEHGQIVQGQAQFVQGQVKQN